MALIECPECGNRVSDKAEKCPQCGLPSRYFNFLDSQKNGELSEKDYKNISNVVISFDNDYCALFSPSHYITHREMTRLHDTYDRFYKPFLNKLIFLYVCNNAATFRIDISGFKSFLRKMHEIDEAAKAHNSEYVERKLEQEKDYFDDILKDIDPNIARQRFNLTKRLSEITKAKVVAVGDDWQSIYAFSGSDISLFTRFLDLMGAGTEMKITHTYRNSQELINIAGSFVQKNKEQIKKQLITTLLRRSSQTRTEKGVL